MNYRDLPARVHEQWTRKFPVHCSERVQVNLDNSRAMSALTFLSFKLNTPRKETLHWNHYIWVSRSHGVMTVVSWIYTTTITPRRQGGFLVTTQYHVIQINQSENRNSHSVWKLNNNRSYWCSRYWTGTSLQLRLLSGAHLFLMVFPCIPKPPVPS